MAQKPRELTPFLRTAYNYDMNKAGDETGINCQYALDQETGELVATPSMTKQQFAEEADINTLVKRFNLTGQLPQDHRMPTYADFEGILTFQDAMNAVVEAQEAFYELPADLRSRFGNDPGQYVDFCSNEKNRDEAIKLGILKPVPAAEITPLPAAEKPVASSKADTPPKGSKSADGDA